MGKTYSKPLVARHGRGTSWARHGNGMLCVNLPLKSSGKLRPPNLSAITDFSNVCRAFIFSVKQSFLLTATYRFAAISITRDALECSWHPPAFWLRQLACLTERVLNFCVYFTASIYMPVATTCGSLYNR
jgi:hypothetical protein